MEEQDIKRSRSRSRSLSQVTSFPFILIIPQRCIEIFGANQGSLIVKIRDQTGVQKIHFSPDLQLENFQDGLVYIYDESIEFKQKALKAILEEINSNSNEEKQHKGFVQSIMIPEPCIGSLIGKNGTTVKQLQKDTNTEISLKKAIKGLEDRRVDVIGSTERASQAVAEIYKIIEKGSTQGTKIETQYNVKGSFIFPNQLVGFIIGKQGSFTKELQSQYRVKLNFYSDQGPPCRQDESICVLTGDLGSVQHAIFKVLEKAQECIKIHRMKDDGVSMLVPSNLIPKLIGQGGCLIKDISQRAKSCHIKVMSEKHQQEKNCQNVIVQLSGAIESKQLAATIILEKIEEFKGKGPEQIISSQKEEPKAEQFRNEQNERNGYIKDSRSPSYDRRGNDFTFRGNRHSNSRSPARNKSQYNNEKSERRKDSRDLEKSSFMDRDGLMRICINVIVPNNLVAMLIGRNGNIIKEIMNKTGAQLMFFSEEDCGPYKTPEGNKGRVCQIKGTVKETSYAFEILINQVIRLENNPPKKMAKD